MGKKKLKPLQHIISAETNHKLHRGDTPAHDPRGRRRRILYTAALLSPEQQYSHPGAGRHSANLQSDRYVPSPGLYLINTEPPKNPGLLNTKGCLNHSIEYGIMLFVAARLSTLCQLRAS